MNCYNPNMYQPNQLYQPYQPYQPINPIVNNIPTGVSVKTVNNFDDITANDVSMNTPYSLFVKSDMSEIQSRSWQNNGIIATTVFKPEMTPSQAENDPIKELYEHIDKRLDDIQRLIKPNRGKKNESENDSNADA